MIVQNDKLTYTPDSTGIEALSLILNTDKNMLMEQILFFDIETTGFAAKNTVCYLIGCVYHKDNNWHYIQWYANSPSDEILVIFNFFEFAQNYKYLVHFNGDGFDIPYILDKCKMLHLPYNFDNFTSIDLLKASKEIKELLKLENHKQKTVDREICTSMR
ncbi:MAG: ribonuclease H-like domain-containing protein [Lachnospira sp.]|nr:ribonuclease H-like domain-containing protein [Lachnospira sp.]